MRRGECPEVLLSIKPSEPVQQAFEGLLCKNYRASTVGFGVLGQDLCHPEAHKLLTLI